jgi:transposase
MVERMQNGTGLSNEHNAAARVGRGGTHTMVFHGAWQFHEFVRLITLEEHARLDSENMELRGRVEGLAAEVQTTMAENQRLIDENQRLAAENQRLYEAAHLGCETSGIPPSKDWKRNGVDEGPAQAGGPDGTDCGQGGGGAREQPGSITGYLNGNPGGAKKRGGQRNHPAAFMHIAGAQEREPVAHYPDKCAACPHLGRCIEEGRFRKAGTSHVYDIEITATHTEHIIYEATECMDDGHAAGGGSPGAIAPQRYGTNVQLLVIAWHHFFHGSYVRIGVAAKELLGLSLGGGTANAIVQRASAGILGCGFIDAVRFFILLYVGVLGVDETSARVGGRNAWVHTSAADGATLLVAHWRRGFEGTVSAGVLQFYVRRLISDCWASYFNEAFKAVHAICCGHIMRELVAAAYFRCQAWAVRMFDLLLEIYESKREAVGRGEGCLPQDYIMAARARYRQIVADGYSENAGVAGGKTYSLLTRLDKLEDAAIAFAVDFSVDFTNNASEISLRSLKVALNVIGQFKTMPGLSDYCIIQSFMDTSRKQGRNPYDMLRVLLSGGDVIEAVFGEAKSAPIKRMIRLTDALACGDEDAAAAVKEEMGQLLTDELISAASFGRFGICDAPPSEAKNSHPSVPKDKMQAAREKLNIKNTTPTTASRLIDFQNNSTGGMPNNDNQKARASPKTA